jgi:hypothetical protein
VKFITRFFAGAKKVEIIRNKYVWLPGAYKQMETKKFVSEILVKGHIVDHVCVHIVIENMFTKRVR